MIYGRLDEFEAMGLEHLGPATTRAVAWIRGLPSEPAEGRYPFAPGEGHALILRYPTGGAEASRFETHRNFVDLQYTLAGAEAIDWAPRSVLQDDGGYNAERDLHFHRACPPLATLIKRAGYFSIHTPFDAHRPMIHVAGHDNVFKLVVKIPVTQFLSR